MRILYYYSKLNIGGAERSTVRLLNSLVQNGHEATLLLRWNCGLLENELDPRVRIIHLKNGNISNGGAVRKAFLQIRETIRMRCCLVRLRKKQFDVAISGLFGYDPAILFHSVNAKQHYQLLRNDVTETGQYGQTVRYMRRYGEHFDAYIGVSQYTTDSFKQTYPQLADRACTIYNILPEPDMGCIMQREDPFAGYEDKLKIVTVCRLAEKAKGLLRMAEVCRILKDEFGDCFRWFVVGSGPDQGRLREKITELGIQDYMLLCGEQQDPFPYYLHADLVAVLSYYEGLCGVVNEAKLLCRPVIATEFSGIHEQLKDGVNGYIVPNHQEAIVEKMREILLNPHCLDALRINGMPAALLSNSMKIGQYEELFDKIERKQGERA